jgi:single-strand DNA-binding protein
MFETPITAIGRVVSDVSTNVTATGDKVSSFRMACQERRFDKTRNTWVDGDRMYLRVNCWRRMADGVTTLAKGDQVLVSGRLRMDEYTTNNGDRRVSPEIDARAIGPDLSWHTVLVNRATWSVHAPPETDDPDRREPPAPDERKEVITEPVAA